MAGMVDSTGDVVKALYKVDGPSFELVGVLKGETAVTQVLTLGFDAASNHILSQDQQAHTDIVGELKDGKIYLCAGPYAETCKLNYVEADKRLVVGLTELAFHHDSPNANADYKPLVTFAGYGIDIAVASPKTADFRLEIAGAPTNAIRLKTDPADGSILFKGKPVGNVGKLMLCSGDFKTVCSLVVNTEDNSLNIFFKMK